MYTNTIIKTEIDEKVIKAFKLDALTRSKLFFKLTTKLAVPFAGVIDGAFSADRSLVCAAISSSKYSISGFISKRGSNIIHHQLISMFLKNLKHTANAVPLRR